MSTSDLNFEPETSRNRKLKKKYGNILETSRLFFLKTTKQKWHNFLNLFNALTWTLETKEMSATLEDHPRTGSKWRKKTNGLIQGPK